MTLVSHLNQNSRACFEGPTAKQETEAYRREVARKRFFNSRLDVLGRWAVSCSVFRVWLLAWVDVHTSATSFRALSLCSVLLAATPLHAEVTAANGSKTSAGAPAPGSSGSAPRDANLDPNYRKLPMGRALRGEALEAYQKAKVLTAKNDLDGAMAQYQRAYALTHESRLFWTMSRVEYLRQNFPESRKWLERYLLEPHNDFPDTDLEAEARIRRYLRDATGEFVVLGVPPGAKVYLDGKEVAEGPLAQPLYVEPGVRSLKVELAGNSPFVREQELKGGQLFTVQVALPESKPTSEGANTTPKAIANATLQVHTNELNSSIQVDRRVVGHGTWRGILPPGLHRVEVLLPGKKPYVAQLQLSAGAQRDLSVRLDAEDETRIWPWLVSGGVVIAAGLAVGGYFLFREPRATSTAPGGGFHAEKP